MNCRTLVSFGPAMAIILATASLNARASITGVTESNGDTDRPSAKYSGQTFNISNPNGTVLVANYTVPRFGDDVKAFTDRVHEWNAASTTVALPKYLVGGEYILNANNNRDNATLSLAVSVSVPSFIYLLIDNRLNDANAGNPPNLGPGSGKMEWVSVANGWTMAATGNNRAGNAAQPDEVGVDENGDGTVDNWSSVYRKEVGIGTATLLEFNEAGRNMYGVVVQPTPEPKTWALLLTGVGLGCWALRRRP